MIGDYFVKKVNRKKIVTFDWADTDETSNLGNPRCFNIVYHMVLKEKPDEIRFHGAFVKIFPKKETKKLIEHMEKIEAVRKKVKEPEIERMLGFNPVQAYYKGLEKEVKAVEALKNLELIKNSEEGEQEAYFKTFKAEIMPSMISANIELDPPKDGVKVGSYKVGDSTITIYQIEGDSLNHLYVDAPEFHLSVQENKSVKDVLDEISQEVELLDPVLARKKFRALALKKTEGNQKLADIIARYSAGYGVLEILLSDERLQDTYIDSPPGSPIYVYHEKYEECTTNIVSTYTQLEKLSSRFRAMSARPFDESSPVLHTALQELGVRVTGICEPLTFKGKGFAFRRHRPEPWTLASFVGVKMMDAKTAGLLSFLVDGQCSLLVTGSRGSGKTSLLSALIPEIPRKFRTIIIEDTPELPVQALKSVGYNIQHIQIEPTLSEKTEKGHEMTAEEALRTSLRLGESVLILGEVRGPEARVLFEAMRIGAAGNVVMGTVHGSSAYDTWDRIVNDLGVPSTSFKAADIIISTASLREEDITKRKRRLMSVTEVRKHWSRDPSKEKGFRDIVKYDRKRDSWKVEIGRSEVIKKIARMKGMTMQRVRENIETRATIISELASAFENVPLEAEIRTWSHYLKLSEEQLKKKKKVDHKKLRKEMKKWIKATF